MLTDFSTSDVSVVLSKVSTAAARTAWLGFSLRQDIREDLDEEEEDDEEEEEDLRPEKVGMVRVERDTRSEDELEP